MHYRILTPTNSILVFRPQMTVQSFIKFYSKLRLYVIISNQQNVMLVSFGNNMSLRHIWSLTLLHLLYIVIIFNISKMCLVFQRSFGCWVTVFLLTSRALANVRFVTDCRAQDIMPNSYV